MSRFNVFLFLVIISLLYVYLEPNFEFFGTTPDGKECNSLTTPLKHSMGDRVCTGDIDWAGNCEGEWVPTKCKNLISFFMTESACPSPVHYCEWEYAINDMRGDINNIDNYLLSYYDKESKKKKVVPGANKVVATKGSKVVPGEKVVPGANKVTGIKKST